MDSVLKGLLICLVVMAGCIWQLLHLYRMKTRPHWIFESRLNYKLYISAMVAVSFLPRKLIVALMGRPPLLFIPHLIYPFLATFLSPLFVTIGVVRGILKIDALEDFQVCALINAAAEAIPGDLTARLKYVYAALTAAWAVFCTFVDSGADYLDTGEIGLPGTIGLFCALTVIMFYLYCFLVG